jgi:L-2-hydroxyglutarate oxidase
MIYDVIIIGGGIVGASCAWQLRRRNPSKRILLLEKENRFAGHQTGHNSGVIHAGIYYQPGSLKAKFCREGNTATIQFCREHALAYAQCGKLLVATNDREHHWMVQLLERAQQNRIDAVRLDRQALKAREPHITGSGAIYVRATGIVDFRQITAKMADLFKSSGGDFKLDSEVVALQEKRDEVAVRTRRVAYRTRHVIACAGLMSDRLVKMLGIVPEFQIIPFRGEYYQLPPQKNRIINHLIYPIPDPDLPFLGVHLTRMIDGTVTVGPNAVLGLKREGYRKRDISMVDIAEMMGFPGFWRVLAQNARSGLSEFKNSFFKRGYLEQVRKYCPEIRLSDLGPYPAGVRAQAVAKDGTLIHDFLFERTARTMHVCNAPSPAATSAMPIGAYILDEAEKHFK